MYDLATSKSIPEEILPALYSSIGMIVTNWSFVENALDHWTAIVFHDFGGSKIEAEMPRMFGRKVKFLSKCFRRIEALSPFKDDAMKVIRRACELSDMRHFVVHGVLSGFDAEDSETFVFRKIDVSEDKKQHLLGEMRLPGEHLVMGGTELINMASFAQKVSARLLDATEA
jgi:hypothetical protein